MPLKNLTRRDFLRIAVATSTSLILPGTSLCASEDLPDYWLIHGETGQFWPVANPVQWSLENARQPILQKAKAGLLNLASSDSDRIIRLVIRRCKLNLIELLPGQVMVHHWGQLGLADLRQFFKTHRLARNDVEVVVSDRKKEVVVEQTGEDFLFGDRLAAEWPVDLYLTKWQRRLRDEPDDWAPAPGTWSGYAWNGIDANRIPWSAMKSAWRRRTGSNCLNCNQPTVLTNFGFPWCGKFHRYPNFKHVCGNCRRLFEDRWVTDIDGWMLANLDVECRPAFIMQWNRRVRLPKW